MPYNSGQRSALASAYALDVRQRNYRLIHMNRITIILFLAALCCGFKPQKSNWVVLASRDGAKTLIYDCRSFQPQVESVEQIETLADALIQTISHAVENKRFATANSMKGAWKARDYRRVEQLVVEYRCTYRAGFTH